MRFLALAISIILSQSVFADMAEWMYQISFEYEGQTNMAYMKADYYKRIPADFIDNEDEFPEFFNDYYKDFESLEVYYQITDRSEIAAEAGFPMHKFLYVESSKAELDPKKMSNIKLVKVWQRSGYGIHLITRIYEDDMSWIGKCTKMSNFGFADIGCRIELYAEDELNKNDQDIRRLYSLLKNDGDYISKKTLEAIRPIVINLKKKQIVVIETCGC